MENSYKPFQLLQVLVVGGAASFALAPSCHAQEPQPEPQGAALATQVLPQENLLDENTLAQDTSLQVIVSFESKRQQLPQVLAELQAQSKVALSVAADSPLATRLLTARASKMPLAHVLASLSRLYGAAWVKQGEAFEMRNNGRGEVENALWKLASTQVNGSRAAKANPIDWSKIGSLGGNALRQKAGIAFEELPGDLAQNLRAQLQADGVTGLGLLLDKARALVIAGGSLRASTSKRSVSDGGRGWKTQVQPGQIDIELGSPDGQPVGTRTIDAVPQDR